jgi:hypothetical protein
MAGSWRDQRNIRMVDRTESGELGATESSHGGFVHVRDELFVTPTAGTVLGLASNPDFVELTSDRPWISAVGLTLYRHSVPDLPTTAAQLHAAARAGAPPLGLDPDDCEVALHYVLSGSPAGYIFRGGPAVAPWAAARVDDLRWGDGPPFVAVLDTGIDPDSTTGLAGGGLGVVRDPELDVDPLIAPGANGGPLGSEAGHGTFISWLIERMAGQDVRITAVKVLDTDGFCTEEQVIHGLNRLREAHDLVNGVHPVGVVNLSLGGYTDDTDYSVEVPSGRDERAHPAVSETFPPDSPPLGLRNALAAWPTTTVFVAAAGNNGVDGRPFWPAALDLPNVVAVGSVDAGLDRSWFSNSGDWVDVSTLGEDILGDYPSGAYPLTETYSEQLAGGAHWSGTSFAAPIVAAEIARRARDLGVTADVAWGNLVNELPEVMVESPNDAAADPPDSMRRGRVWDPRVAGLGINPQQP